MNDWIRLGGWAALGLVLLWVVLKVVAAIFSFVSWVVSTLVSLVVVAVLLYLVYLGVSRFVGGSGSSTRSREREKLFE